MQQIVEGLTVQHEQLDRLLAGLDDPGWATPTRCPGWTVADVVLHLAQTDELAVASAEGCLAEAAAGWTASGDALEFCLIGACRRDPTDTGLRAEGPDAFAVLDFVRTYT